MISSLSEKHKFSVKLYSNQFGAKLLNFYEDQKTSAFKVWVLFFVKRKMKTFFWS